VNETLKGGIPMLSPLCTGGKDSQEQVFPQGNIYLPGASCIGSPADRHTDQCSSGFSSTRGLAPVPAISGNRPRRMQHTVPGCAIGVSLTLSWYKPNTRSFKQHYPLTS